MKVFGTKMPRAVALFSLVTVASTLSGAGSPAGVDPDAANGAPIARVSAVIETVPVPDQGDAADDPAIWVNPDNPAASTIIGTNKRGGLAVYDLSGTLIQYLPDGRMNNVDVRGGFKLAGQEVGLVTSGNRTDNSVAIYRVDAKTRKLENVAARTITTAEA